RKVNKIARTLFDQKWLGADADVAIRPPRMVGNRHRLQELQMPFLKAFMKISRVNEAQCAILRVLLNAKPCEHIGRWPVGMKTQGRWVVDRRPLGPFRSGRTLHHRPVTIHSDVGPQFYSPNTSDQASI